MDLTIIGIVLGIGLTLVLFLPFIYRYRLSIRDKKVIDALLVNSKNTKFVVFKDGSINPLDGLMIEVDFYNKKEFAKTAKITYNFKTKQYNLTTRKKDPITNRYVDIPAKFVRRVE